ncbi:MAG: substrate-binding domain-containing protein [Sneathiella sp.]
MSIRAFTFWIGFLFLSPTLAAANCIGVVTAGGGIGFWGDVKKGAELAGRELAIPVHVRGAVEELNHSGQRSIIDFMVLSGCGGLVLAPTTSERKKDVLKLKADGIPTVYIDRDIGGASVSVIKTNNSQAGTLAGVEMAKALGGEGRIAVFRQNRQVTTTRRREDAFIKAAIAGGLEVVMDAYIGSNVGDARSLAFELLNKEIRIDGIFTPNESTSLGVIKALEALGLSGEIVHIGFDVSKDMIAAIKSARMFGAVVQQPFQMGYQGVRAVHQAMAGKRPEKYIDIGVVFVQKNNIEDAKIMNLLGLN